MCEDKSAARIEDLKSQLSRHEHNLELFANDEELRHHIKVSIHRTKACIHAEHTEPDDDLRYYLAAHRWAAENGDLSEDTVCGERVRTKSFEDRCYFDPSTAAVLDVLQAEYGDAVYVYTKTYTPPTGRDGVVKDARFIWEVILLHEDLLPSKSVLKYRGSKTIPLRHPYSVFQTMRDHPFMIGGSDNFYNLVTTLRCRSVQNPKLDPILERALGSVEVASEGVRSIPTWTTTTMDDDGLSYDDCPSFGSKIGFDSALLLTDGVVVDLEGFGRYRVRFDYTLYVREDDGWMDRHPAGERVLRVQRTDEPLTEPKERTGCRMRGKGSSQQANLLAPFKGQAPYCLMVLHIDDADFTITVMVDIEGGEIVRAWVEGSCT